MNVSKIETVDVAQSIWGRLLDYGTVVVRGTGATIEPLSTVAAPPPDRFRHPSTAPAKIIPFRPTLIARTRGTPEPDRHLDVCGQPASRSSLPS